MLNYNNILTYIKGRMSLPSGFLEKTDQEIIDWIKLTTIPEYSQYYPDKEYTAVIPTDSRYIATPREGEFYFFDEENLPIYDILDCYMSSSNLVTTGHPMTGVTSINSLPTWTMEVFQSTMFSKFTDFSYTFHFIQPNIVKVLPSENGFLENFVVYYERQQPEDLRRIPNAMSRDFMDLCLSDILIWIGNMRAMYSDTNTPFGNLSLRGDELKADGERLKEELISKFREDTLPPIIIDVY
jgi:hypothetical protein